MKKYGILIVVLLLAYSIYAFISDYRRKSLNQYKYGIEFNEERRKLGLDEIPESFVLTEKPINNLFDYFKFVGIYSLEFTADADLDSGLVKKRIDVYENDIGIVREYSYYKTGNDTIVEIHKFY